MLLAQPLLEASLANVATLIRAKGKSAAMDFTRQARTCSASNFEQLLCGKMEVRNRSAEDGQYESLNVSCSDRVLS
jgi:hypothetical protein